MEINTMSDTTQEETIIDSAQEMFNASIPPAPIQNNDIFGDLGGYEPKVNEEKTFIIEALNGKYNATITKFQRMTGEFPSGDQYDKYCINMQICETVNSKVDGLNRYVSKEYNLLDTQYSTGKETLEKMFNDIYTGCGKVIDTTGNTPDEVFSNIDLQIMDLVGSVITIKAFPQKYKKTGEYNGVKFEKGKIKYDKSGYPKHYVQVLPPHVKQDDDVVDLT